MNIQPSKEAGLITVLKWIHSDFLLIGYENGSVDYLDVFKNSNKALWNIKLHQEPVLSISSNDQFGISTSADNKICKWIYQVIY